MFDNSVLSQVIISHCKSDIRVIDVTKTGSLRRIKQPTVTLYYFLQVPFPHLYLKSARVYQSTTLSFIKKIPAKTCHLCKLKSQRPQYRKYQVYTVFMPMTSHLTCIWRNPHPYILNEGHQAVRRAIFDNRNRHTPVITLYISSVPSLSYSSAFCLIKVISVETTPIECLYFLPSSSLL